MDSVITEISILLAIAAAVAVIMRLLKQPLIIGHILTGILVGPAVFGLVKSPETIEAFASFGIALLLFIVGLGLNPKVVKDVGKVSFLTGVGQVVFTSAVGFFLVRALGYSTIVSFYVSVALTFSSTIIVLKLLTDKKEHTKLYGKISIGFLLVQDIIATFALLVASAAGTGGFSYHELLVLILRGSVFIAWAYILTTMIIKPLTGFISKSQELLALLGIAWGLGVGVTAQKLGFSLEVGALFAGILLASMSYAQEISSRLRPLRDFFIVVFFIALGAKLNLADMGAVVWQALLLSIFVLVGNPLIVIAIMGLLGYTKKTSFKAGLAVAQISEFSLIFILLGFRNGQVSGQAVSLVTLVGIITIAVSSYMIIYSDGLFHLIEKYLYLFERRKVKIEHDKTRYFDAVLFGYKRGGHEYVKMFPTISKNFGVIDYDPDVIDDMERKNIPYIYGDATDIELIEEIGLDRSRLIIVNITDHDTNVSLLTTLEKINHKAVIICHADNVHEAAELYGLGATYVILPAYIGSEKISNFIKKSGLKKSEFKQYREKHLEYLQTHYLLDGDE